MRGGGPLTRVAFRSSRESRHKGIGNPTVELLALAPHHRGVGRLLHQRMFENVTRIRRLPTNGDQPTSHQMINGALQRGVRYLGNRDE